MEENNIFSTLLSNESYNVEITCDNIFSIGSSDNRRYDFVINPGNRERGDRYLTLRLSVEGASNMEIALITDLIERKNCSAILEGDILILLHRNYVTSVDLTNGKAKSRELNVWGESYDLIRMADGYLVHGEFEIIKLDNALNTLWEFSGRDVFVSGSGKKSLEITEKSIILYDFLDNYYELDFCGNLIKEILSV